MWGWILFGIILAGGLEATHRVLTNYERVESKPQRKVQVSFPWYVTLGGAYGIYKGTHPKKEKKS